LKKILIFARSFVRNGKFTPYVLCSEFRPYLKLSEICSKNTLNTVSEKITVFIRKSSSQTMIRNNPFKGKKGTTNKEYIHA
jgi:hypothetical protein